MPISIPMMQRRPSGADLAAASRDDPAAGAGGDDFVPPHVLYRQESEREMGASARAGVAGAEPSLGGLSPTTAAKREKLLARNAILRSTGFIEVQQAAVVQQATIGACGLACALRQSWRCRRCCRGTCVAAIAGADAGAAAAGLPSRPAAHQCLSCLPSPAAGEVLDPVKEQLLAALAASSAGGGASAPLGVPAAGEGARQKARSSLSQLLGTSK